MPETESSDLDTSESQAEQVRFGLEQLRLRLLDLTSRNKLLSFRHTRSTLRIVDADLDRLYAELVAGQKLPFLHLPEPTNEEVRETGEKPGAKLYAEQLGWTTTYDLPYGIGRSGCLPVLLYRDDFESLVRKISTTAKTAIEESGVNLLHLIFGFLEWRESDDSTEVRHAPLLIVPVQLFNPKAKEEDRTVKVQYVGEDLNTNLSLVEKMRRDFNIDIPLLQEDETPEQYFRRFDQVLEHKREWRISRQVSLGLLSFGKLLMYLDLDAERWPAKSLLTQHPRLTDIFAKRSASELEFATEYEIDEEEKKGFIPHVVCEADSSQHSALLDAVRGKNLVIEGPPGTGKSQTITNLIATFLGQGKRVLFVAEKMAALEVVKRRLDQCGLGEFCLELHSHKTSKAELLKSLDTRIIAHNSFPEPATLNHKLGLLAHRRDELTRYVSLLNSPYGAIAQSPFELIWHREQARRELPPDILDPQAVVFPNADKWDFTAWHEHKGTVGALQAHLLRFRDAGGEIDKALNCWDWLPTCHLDQSGQQALLLTLSKLREALELHCSLLRNFNQILQGLTPEPTIWLTTGSSWLFQVPEPDSTVLMHLLLKCSGQAERFALEEFIRRKSLYAETITALPANGITLLNSDVPEQIKYLMQEMESVGITKFNLKQLQDLLNVLSDAKKQYSPAGRAVAAFAIALDVPSSFSIRCLTDLITTNELLEEAPLPLLHLRDKKFEHEGLLPLLVSAKSESIELDLQRNSIGTGLLLDSAHTIDQLESAATVIESTSWIKRWFSSRYKQAVLLFDSVCLDSRIRKVDEMASCLRSISRFKSKLIEFADREDLKAQLTTDFHGVDTHWNDLMSLASWYEKVSVRLPQHLEFANNLRSAILTLPAVRLKGILASTPSDVPRSEDLRPLFQSLENLHTLLPQIDFERDTAPIDVFLEDASQVVVKIQAFMDTMNSVELPPQTDDLAIRQLIATVGAARGLRESIQSDEFIKDFLGDDYLGVETNTQGLSKTLSFVQEVQQASLPSEIKIWLIDFQFAERKASLEEWATDYDASLILSGVLEQELVAAIKIEVPFPRKTSIVAVEKATWALDKCLAARNLLPM